MPGASSCPQIAGKGMEACWRLDSADCNGTLERWLDKTGLYLVIWLHLGCWTNSIGSQRWSVHYKAQSGALDVMNTMHHCTITTWRTIPMSPDVLVWYQSGHKGPAPDAVVHLVFSSTKSGNGDMQAARPDHTWRWRWSDWSDHKHRTTDAQMIQTLPKHPTCH